MARGTQGRAQRQAASVAVSSRRAAGMDHLGCCRARISFGRSLARPPLCFIPPAVHGPRSPGSVRPIDGKHVCSVDTTTCAVYNCTRSWSAPCRAGPQCSGSDYLHRGRATRSGRCGPGRSQCSRKRQVQTRTVCVPGSGPTWLALRSCPGTMRAKGAIAAQPPARHTYCGKRCRHAY